MSLGNLKIGAHVLVVSLKRLSAIKEKISNKNFLYHRRINSEGVVRYISRHGFILVQQYNPDKMAAYAPEELIEQLTLNYES